MERQGTVAVIGAGVVGSAIASALAREGRAVLLLDPAPPGEAGASFGNAGHVATELVEPLPSLGLLLGFWSELFAAGGVLDIPLARLGAFAPWALRFARAAFHQRTNTRHLAPFMRPAVPALMDMLRDAGHADLIRQHGHYEVFFGAGAQRRANAEAWRMAGLEVATEPARDAVLRPIARAAGFEEYAGLWFPHCAHVRDPLEVVRAFAADASRHGATLLRRRVRAVRVTGDSLTLDTDAEAVVTTSAIVCAGVWSAPLLTPFGFRVPLEAARGYHIQMPAAEPLVDAPIVYAERKIVVTPMEGRVRATSFMEFAGADAPPDPRKPAWLRHQARALGYECADDVPDWVGPRPVLADYLPAIGRVAQAPNLLYAFGHQHVGLTLCAVTARVVADLVAGREPRHDVSAFDLSRF